MSALQTWVVLAYLTIVFMVGVVSVRFVKNTEDYLLAGRRLGWVLATAALAATHFGGGFVIGTGAWAYERGLSGVAYAIGVGASLLVLAVVAAGRMRRLGLVTVPDYLEHRYQSRTVRMLGALLSLLAIIGILGAQIWASQGALSLLGLNPTVAALVASGAFITYTAISGLWGATLTDVLQLAVIFIGIPLVALGGLEAAGGWASVQAQVLETSPELAAEGYFHWVGDHGLLLAVAVIPTIMYTLIGQDFYQRLFAAKSDRIAIVAAVLAGTLLMAYATFPAITGIVARALFSDTIEPSQAIAMVIGEVLGPWSGAIVLGAIIAAILSTADSLLIAGSAHVTHDILEKGLGWTVPEKYALWVARLSTVLIGLVALILALNVQAIIELLLMSYTMYAAGVFIPVLLGLYWSKGSRLGALAGILIGSTASILVATEAVSIEPWPPIIIGAMASLLSYVLVSMLTQSHRQNEGHE